MLARWDAAVGLDTDGARDLPSRQRTLRSAFDWSYDLLELDEQALLRRLAAFPDGFDVRRSKRPSAAMVACSRRWARPDLDPRRPRRSQPAVPRGGLGGRAAFSMLATVRSLPARTPGRGRRGGGGGPLDGEVCATAVRRRTASSAPAHGRRARPARPRAQQPPSGAGGAVAPRARRSRWTLERSVPLLERTSRPRGARLARASTAGRRPRRAAGGARPSALRGHVAGAFPGRLRRSGPYGGRVPGGGAVGRRPA